MSKHEFEPIDSESKLAKAVEYVATSSVRLAQTVLNCQLDVDTLCFFAQSSEEYKFLLSAVKKRGPISKFTHGPTTYVDTDFNVAGHRIRIFGVREPDPTRPEIGYGDYTVKDYAEKLNEIQSSPYAQEISTGRGQSLIELRHPDFDVRGYVANVADHNS